MKPVTPYGKADELAHQNERLVQALRRERRALATERARIKAVRRELDRLEVLALTSRSENIGILGFSWVTTIRRALDGEP